MTMSQKKLKCCLKLKGSGHLGDNCNDNVCISLLNKNVNCYACHCDNTNTVSPNYSEAEIIVCALAVASEQFPLNTGRHRSPGSPGKV